MALSDQDFVVKPVPPPRPVFVRPHQAEREVQALVLEKRFERLVQQALAVEPVEVEAEALDTGVAGKLDLTLHDAGRRQVVVSQVTGNSRLIVACKTWQPARHV